jgi:hypothetical protein
MEKTDLQLSKNGTPERSHKNVDSIMRWHSERLKNNLTYEEVDFFDRIYKFYKRHHFVSEKQFSSMVEYFERSFLK